MSKLIKFLSKCENKGLDKDFNYDNTVYSNSVDKINIKCIKHNFEFSQSPSEHLRGKKACIHCSKNPKVDTEFFINKSIGIHGDKYDYSLTKYVDAKTKLIVICKTHGPYHTLPNNHYKQNCPKCYNDKRNLTNLQFYEKSELTHSNKYDYSLTNYTSSKIKVDIICEEHGTYSQTPNDHLNGKGCPKCGLKYDKSETEVKDFIKSLGVNFISNDKSIIKPFELDIYIPSHNITIEYNGLYWHSELFKDNKYHLNKTNKCLENGIKLIHIFEDEWVNKKDIVKSRISNMLGLNENRIYARKCEVKNVLVKEKTKFLNDNHIQGAVGSKINLGLYYNNELVSLMTFGDLRRSLGSKPKNGNYELIRFCNKINTSVIGGASKLFKNFTLNNRPIDIISYADRRWSQGSLYDTLGFNFIHNSKPNYFYVFKGNRVNRFKFRKSELLKEGFDVNKTEHEIMLERKLYRIYDCGTMLYKKTLY